MQYIFKAISFKRVILPAVLICLSASAYGSKVLSPASDVKVNPADTAHRITLKTYVIPEINTTYSRLIEKNAVTQVEQALNGSVPGLYSMRNGGYKFGVSNYNFFVRGKATTGDNTPLILIDGVDGNINLLSPREIESITVVKDPVHLATFGLRGANGVIYVQTKRGSSVKAHMDIDVQYGMMTPEFIGAKLNAFEYATLHNEANANDGANPVFQPENYVGESNPYLFPRTDFTNDFLKQSASYKQLSFSASGGNDIAKYYTLVSYMRQDGIFDMPDNLGALNQTYNERYNFRTNLDVNLGKGFVLNTNINAVFDDRRSPWYSSSYNANSTNSYIFNSLMKTPANAFPLINPNGSLGGTSEYRDNPVALLGSGTRVENTRQLTANVSLKKDLSDWIKGLSVSMQYAFENYNAYYKANYRVYGVSQYNADSTYSTYGVDDTKLSTAGGQMSDYYSDMTFNATALYNRTFGLSTISASVNFNEYVSNVSGDVPAYKWLGTSSQFMYNYDNRYSLGLTGTYQGSNSYAPGKRFGFFPAANLMWDIAREDFFNTSDVVSGLKFRSSFGLNANDRTGGARFMHRQAYYNTGGYGFGNPNGTSQGSYEGTLGNYDASWEESLKLNSGFDLSFFERKLNARVEYFLDNRSAILVNQSNLTPALVGIALSQYNAGKIRNSGFEGALNYNDVSGDFKWYVNANVLYAKNKIIDLKEISYPDNESYRYRKGHSVDALFGLEADGLYANQQAIDEDNVISTFGTIKPGDIRYVDQNNDGIINQADKKVIANLFPELIFGLNAGFEYRNFDFFVQTEGSGMFDVHIRPDQFSDYAFQNRFVGNEAISANTYPRLSFTSEHNAQTSTYWVQKVSLLRISAIEAGYNLPEKMSKVLRLQGLRIYARANNLYSNTEKREGRDFESLSAGVSQYPAMRTFLMGLTVKL
jgi:TonB-linked SusC/RagA family outer membrane protein